MKRLSSFDFLNFSNFIFLLYYDLIFRFFELDSSRQKGGFRGMPATNKTETLGLNLWQPEDRPLRADFCADNEAVEAAFVSHLADTTLHKTPQDGINLLCGTYAGSGELQQFDLGFTPQLVFVFDQNTPAVTKAADGTVETRFFCIGPQSQPDTAPAFVSLGTLYIMPGTTENGARTALNDTGSQYQYIAVR